MSTTFFDFIRDRKQADLAGLRAASWAKLVRLAWQVRRERDQLARLTPEQLADIGIHPTVADLEVNRELFDLPKHRVARTCK